MLVNAGKGDDEACAAFGAVERFDGSVVRVDDALCNSEAEPGASGVARAGVVAAVEPREQSLGVDVAEPGSIVEHAHDRLLRKTFQLDRDMAAFADESACVGDEVTMTCCRRSRTPRTSRASPTISIVPSRSRREERASATSSAMA